MILLLSGYDAASHRRWRIEMSRRLTADGHQVESRALPPRHFRWRIRGNALEFASDADLWAKDWDLIIATSAVDVATLRGLTRTKCPWIVYVHENQFAYPLRVDQRKRDGALLIRDLYAVLAADVLVFNSQFNRDSLLEGARKFLARMPDYNAFDPGPALERASVLPVGLEDEFFEPRPTEHRTPPTLLWNHRWEWDKAPETFFDALDLLDERDLDFRLNIVGQQFRNAPAVFEAAHQRHEQRIRRWGYQEKREDYLEALDESDFVISTSLHEYQGLAVMEAAARGATPVLPNRLAYPEFFEREFLYDSTPEQPELEARTLATKLESLMRDGREAPSMQEWSWAHIWPKWRRLLEDALG